MASVAAGCKAHNGHCRLKMTRRPTCVVLMKEEVMSRRLRTSHWLTHQKVNENLKLWLPLRGKQFATWLFTHKLQIGLKPFERAPCWGRPRDFIQRCSSFYFPFGPNVRWVGFSGHCGPFWLCSIILKWPKIKTTLPKSWKSNGTQKFFAWLATRECIEPQL